MALSETLRGEMALKDAYNIDPNRIVGNLPDAVDAFLGTSRLADWSPGETQEADDMALLVVARAIEAVLTRCGANCHIHCPR